MQDTIEKVAAMGAMACAAASDKTGPGSVHQDFAILNNAGEPLAAALVKVADRNPRIRRILEAGAETGAYGELLVVVLGGIVLPIAMNHGFNPFAEPIPSSSTPADATHAA